MKVSEYGYDKFFKIQFEKAAGEGSLPARIISESRNHFKVVCEKGFFEAKLSGKLRQSAIFKSDLPAVGDWVAIYVRRDKAFIHAILDRKSSITRKTAGKVFDRQVLSSNIDVLFIVTSLDCDFNINRLGRYVSLAKTGRVKPVILLSKSDLVSETGSFAGQITENFPSVPVHSVSVKDENTLKLMEKYLKKGVAASFVGSSGVGKSTLINMLAGEDIRKTAEVSKTDNKGRHTTSQRELILLENGGIVIDTPGIRELQVWDEDISSGFEDIEKLSQDCRFFDCMHDTEPDCAVKKGVEEGTISAKRLEKWKERKKEIEEMVKNKELSAKILAKRKFSKKNK